MLTLIFACLHILCKWSHTVYAFLGLVFEEQVFEVGRAMLEETSAVFPPAPSAGREHWVPSAPCGKGMGVLVGKTLGSPRRSRWEILPGAPQSSLADVGRQWGKMEESCGDTSHQTGCRPPQSLQLLPMEGLASPRSLGLSPDATERRPLCNSPNSSLFLLIIHSWSPSMSYLVLQLTACKRSGKRLRPPDFSY